MEIYSEERAQEIRKRIEAKEKAQFNKKACARKAAEDLCFDKEIARLSDSMAYMLSELSND